MKLTAKRDALLETLGKVKPVIPARATLPILHNVLLTAKQGQLAITANNLEVAAICICKAKISKTGSVGVSPKVLEDFLKNNPAEKVSLTATTRTQRWTERSSRYNRETEQMEPTEVKRSRKTLSLTVEAGAASFTIDADNPKDFPGLPKAGGKPIVLHNLDQAIGEVLYAVATEESRPVLAGVCFTQKGSKVELAAADGFRLAMSSVKIGGKLKEQVIIPALALKMVMRFLPGKVTASVFGKDERDKAMVFHQKDGLMVMAKTIPGTFPKYEMLIPKKGRRFKVATAEFKKAVDTVAAIKPTSDIVRLQTKGTTLTVSGRNENGETRVKLPVAGRVQTGFNSKYLKDLLKLAGEDFLMRMETNESPGVVKNNGTTHVLMPMHIQ